MLHYKLYVKMGQHNIYYKTYHNVKLPQYNTIDSVTILAKLQNRISLSTFSISNSSIFHSFFSFSVKNPLKYAFSYFAPHASPLLLHITIHINVNDTASKSNATVPS